MRKPTSSAKPSARGLKCVLLVAPEDSTRLTAKWALTNFGYQVDAARCAEEALALFDPLVHDAVATVDVMPGISGLELAHVIKLRSPRTPVVLLATRAAPANRSCLDAVLRPGARLSGLNGTLQRLLGQRDAKGVIHTSPG